MSSKNVVDLRGWRPRTPTPRQAPAPRGRRQSPLQRRRRRIRLILLGILVVVLGGIAYGIHYVSYLPQFRIEKIDVQGTKELPVDVVSSYVHSILDNGTRHYIARDNILVYPKQVIEQDLVKDFPRVSAAHLSRDGFFGTTLHVAITERTPYAAWCVSVATSTDAGDCFALDSDGYVFARTEDTHLPFATKYIFSGGPYEHQPGWVFAPSHMPGITALLDALAAAGLHPTGASLAVDQDLQVPLSEGFYLKVSYGENPDDVVRNLKLVLQSNALSGKQGELEYVDLRFGNRVYYKLVGQDQVGQ